MRIESRRINVINARQLIVECNTSEVKEKKEHKEDVNRITSLEFSDNYKIEAGMSHYIEVNGKKEKYNIAEINLLKKKKKSYHLLTASRTKTSFYVLPMLGKDKDYWEWDRRLVNAYIDAEDHDSIDFNIFLLYRIDTLNHHDMFEVNTIAKHKMFKERYPVDKYHVMYVFNIPEKYKKDYIMFMQGKYSEMDDKYKVDILKFHKVHNRAKKSKLEKWLYKDQGLRAEMEIELGAGGEKCVISRRSELDSVPNFKETDVFLNSMRVI